MKKTPPGSGYHYALKTRVLGDLREYGKSFISADEYDAAEFDSLVSAVNGAVVKVSGGYEIQK